MTDQVALSVCIPTFNRCGQVIHLVSTLLQVPGSFEVCVHDDGSSDDTQEKLLDLSRRHEKLKFSSARNAGRATAIKNATDQASGKYIMIFDDDDEIFPETLFCIIENCENHIPDNIAGYIYQMSIDGKDPQNFPIDQTNLIALRADYGVKGDKKEVIKAHLIKSAIAEQPNSRRVPTSLYWFKISLTHDIFCRNTIVGNKIYQTDGLTHSISSIKLKNSAPMASVYYIRLKAFFLRRYKSPVYAAKSALGWVYYNFVNLWPHK